MTNRLLTVVCMERFNGLRPRPSLTIPVMGRVRVCHHTHLVIMVACVVNNKWYALQTHTMVDLPDGEFDLIYADPPWRYESATARPSDAIENHYDTLPLDEIKDLDIPAADDCVLYLWTTAPKTGEAIDVIRSWGFTYRTNAVWDKRRLGLGHWFRVNHELLMVAVTGNASPPEEQHRRGSIFREERGEHSEKPDKVRRHIEKAHPDADKLELFSRDGRVGWTMWGNEAIEQPQDLITNYG